MNFAQPAGIAGRQGALANGLHGLNPRNTGRGNTPLDADRPFCQGPSKQQVTTVEQDLLRVNDDLKGLWMLKSIGRGQEGQSFHPWGTVRKEKTTVCSSAWSEFLPWKQGVAGSNPATQTNIWRER